MKLVTLAGLAVLLVAAGRLSVALDRPATPADICVGVPPQYVFGYEVLPPITECVPDP